MFNTQQGTRWTTTIAFLVIAFVFSPAILMISRPVGYASVSLAVWAYSSAMAR